MPCRSASQTSARDSTTRASTRVGLSSPRRWEEFMANAAAIQDTEVCLRQRATGNLVAERHRLGAGSHPPWLQISSAEIRAGDWTDINDAASVAGLEAGPRGQHRTSQGLSSASTTASSQQLFASNCRDVCGRSFRVGQRWQSQKPRYRAGRFRPPDLRRAIPTRWYLLMVAMQATPRPSNPEAVKAFLAFTATQALARSSQNGCNVTPIPGVTFENRCCSALPS